MVDGTTYDLDAAAAMLTLDGRTLSLRDLTATGRGLSLQANGTVTFGDDEPTMDLTLNGSAGCRGGSDRRGECCAPARPHRSPRACDRLDDRSGGRVRCRQPGARLAGGDGRCGACLWPIRRRADRARLLLDGSRAWNGARPGHAGARGGRREPCRGALVAHRCPPPAGPHERDRPRGRAGRFRRTAVARWRRCKPAAPIRVARDDGRRGRRPHHGARRSRDAVPASGGGSTSRRATWPRGISMPGATSASIRGGGKPRR